MKKFVSILLSIIVVIGNSIVNVKGDENMKREEVSFEEYFGDIAASSNANMIATNNMLDQAKFITPQGHGFAAERGNNFYDFLKGYDTKVIGDNNVKNGADRVIRFKDGSTLFIQDKYYSTARDGINACFENGEFRYFTETNGQKTPMVIEVPKDQYDDAVLVLQEKIRNGEMKNVGITDPNEAQNYIRKGALEYKQALNLAKAGTIESLKYDALNGAITASCAFGISTLVNFSVNVLNGMDTKQAIKESAMDGLKSGGIVFATSVIGNQLAKTNVVKVFTPSAESLVKALGDKYANALINVYGRGGETLAKDLTKQATKILQNQMLVSTVTIVVLSVEDVVDLFKGRISKEQLIKNIVTTTAGVAGGAAGALVGTALAPSGPIGSFAGGVLGSIVVGSATTAGTSFIIKYFYQEDADQMMEIISTKFQEMCNDYLIDEEEGNTLTIMLQKELTGDCLKDMFASDNREKFAEELMIPLFESVAKSRERIITPSESQMRNELKTSLKDVVFIH